MNSSDYTFEDLEKDLWSYYKSNTEITIRSSKDIIVSTILENLIKLLKRNCPNIFDYLYVKVLHELPNTLIIYTLDVNLGVHKQVFLCLQIEKFSKTENFYLKGLNFEGDGFGITFINDLVNTDIAIKKVIAEKVSDIEDFEELTCDRDFYGEFQDKLDELNLSLTNYFLLESLYKEISYEDKYEMVKELIEGND